MQTDTRIPISGIYQTIYAALAQPSITAKEAWIQKEIYIACN